MMLNTVRMPAVHTTRAGLGIRAGALMLVVAAVLAGCGGSRSPSAPSTDAGRPPAEYRGDAPNGWGPEDLRSAYDLPASTPHPGTIALITVGPYPTLSDDLAVYRSRYGLPACTTANGCFAQIDYHGGPALPLPSSDAEKKVAQALAVETAIDVDMASAICPACRLLDVQIPTGLAPPTPTQASDYAGYANAFGAAVDTAVAHSATAVSISFTMPGSAGMLRGPLAHSFDHPGVAIVAASGDYGFNGSGNSIVAQAIYQRFSGDAYIWPQALPTVTSAGGTTMIKEGARYVQGAWPQAGSGCTPGIGPAVGQPPTVSRLCSDGRAGADVSAVAENLAIYDAYRPADNAKVGWLVMSGTSLAAPQIAGMYAASGRLRDVHGPNTLYQAPSTAFTDVSSGSNAQVGNDTGSCIATWQVARDVPPTPLPNRLCTAQPGWDGPTGLGIPRGLGGF